MNLNLTFWYFNYGLPSKIGLGLGATIRDNTVSRFHFKNQNSVYITPQCIWNFALQYLCHSIAAKLCKLLISELTGTRMYLHSFPPHLLAKRKPTVTYIKDKVSTTYIVLRCDIMCCRALFFPAKHDNYMHLLLNSTFSNCEWRYVTSLSKRLHRSNCTSHDIGVDDPKYRVVSIIIGHVYFASCGRLLSICGTLILREICTLIRKKYVYYVLFMI